MSYSIHVVSKLLLFLDSTQPLMKLHGLVVEVNELLLVIVALKLVQGKPGLYQGGADGARVGVLGNQVVPGLQT